MTNIEKILEVLGAKIKELECDIYIKNITIERLENEIKQLKEEK